jgi:hypothetical protein
VGKQVDVGLEEVDAVLAGQQQRGHGDALGERDIERARELDPGLAGDGVGRGHARRPRRL